MVNNFKAVKGVETRNGEAPATRQEDVDQWILYMESASNEALIASLRLAKKLQAHHLKIYSDSQLVVNQVNDIYLERGEKMASYLEKAKGLMKTIQRTSIEVIPWSKNANGNILAKLASTRDTELLDSVLVEFLVEPNIKQQLEVIELVQEPSWMNPIIVYLKNGELPEGKIEAQILRLKAARYVLYDNKLYRKGYSMPLLKCVPPFETEYIMKEIHEGICKNHTEG